MKVIILPDKRKRIILSEFNSSGIAITYTKKHKTFDIFGWYDTFVGIQGDNITLADLLHIFGITLKDCQKVLEK